MARRDPNPPIFFSVRLRGAEAPTLAELAERQRLDSEAYPPDERFGVGDALPFAQIEIIGSARTLGIADGFGLVNMSASRNPPDVWYPVETGRIWVEKIIGGFRRRPGSQWLEFHIFGNRFGTTIEAALRDLYTVRHLLSEAEATEFRFKLEP